MNEADQLTDEEWLRLPVIGPELTLQAVTVRMADGSTRLRVTCFQDGEVYDPLKAAEDTRPHRAIRAAMRTIEQGMTEADRGMRVYLLKLCTIPGAVPNTFNITLETTLPDSEFNSSDPLQPLMAVLGQYAAALLPIFMKAQHAQVNENLRPPGHPSGNALP